MTDQPAHPDMPRYSLPDADLLDGASVTQIVLLHEDHTPVAVDLELPAKCRGHETITLLDACREIKRRRLQGTLQPAQVLMFYTKFADANDPSPAMLWVYDALALPNRSLVVSGSYSYAVVETWEVQPSGG